MSESQVYFMLPASKTVSAALLLSSMQATYIYLEQ